MGNVEKRSRYEPSRDERIRRQKVAHVKWVQSLSRAQRIR